MQTLSDEIPARPGPVKAWVLASRPKTLAAAGTPVLIGWALAFSDGGFDWIPALLCLVFALLMQIDANLINDLGDYLQGSDGEGRLGPRRACAEGWIAPRTMKRGIELVTAAAGIVGSGLLYYGGWWLVAVGAGCILFAFLYTSGPYPLAYHGWGDLLVLVFFGIVPVGCTYYILTGGWSFWTLPAALASGLAVDTLLMVNNYRDREQDALNGKRTLAVRWGATIAGRLYLSLGILAVLCCLGFVLRGDLWAGLLPLAYLPVHISAWRRMTAIRSGRALNRILGLTSRNMLLLALLFSAGLLLG